ncbi:MAG: hypothetical protein ACKO6K_07405 [Chitinophagaceae bacterium]
MKVNIWGLTLCLLCAGANGQQKITASSTAAPRKAWYDNFSIRGYMQIRYNRLMETNSKLKCEQCDRSWGEGGGLFIRMGRIIFSGNIAKNVFFYIQPDFGPRPALLKTSFNFGMPTLILALTRRMNSGYA